MRRERVLWSLLVVVLAAAPWAIREATGAPPSWLASDTGLLLTWPVRSVDQLRRPVRRLQESLSEQRRDLAADLAAPLLGPRQAMLALALPGGIVFTPWRTHLRHQEREALALLERGSRS